MKKNLLVFVPFLIIVVFIGLIALNCVFFVKDREKQQKAAEIAALFKAYYDMKVASYEEENPTLENVDVAFLGDSLTDGYDVKSYYPDLNVVNRGIGGDTTFGLENRLQVSAYDVNPKVIVMLIGANNIYTMFQNYERIVQSLRSHLPNTKIILISLSPLGANFADRNDTVISNNVEIQNIASRNGCTYVDIHSILRNPETGQMYDEYTIEGLHFSAEGYVVITNTLRPVIDSLLA